MDKFSLGCVGCCDKFVSTLDLTGTPKELDVRFSGLPDSQFCCGDGVTDTTFRLSHLSYNSTNPCWSSWRDTFSVACDFDGLILPGILVELTITGYVVFYDEDDGAYDAGTTGMYVSTRVFHPTRSSEEGHHHFHAGNTANQPQLKPPSWQNCEVGPFPLSTFLRGEEVNLPCGKSCAGGNNPRCYVQAIL